MGMRQQVFGDVFVPYSLLFVVFVELPYHFLVGLALYCLVVVVKVRTQAAVVSEILAAYPCGSGRASPVAADYADCYAEPAAELLCKVVSHSRPCPCLVGRGRAPAALSLGSCQLVPKHGAFRRIVESDVFAVAARQSRSALALVLQLELHIGLTACKPYLAYGNVTEYLFHSAAGYFQSTGAVLLSGRQHCLPPAVFYHGSCGAFKLGDTDVYDLFIFAASTENADILVSLQHHIVAENSSSLHGNSPQFIDFLDFYLNDSAPEFSIALRSMKRASSRHSGFAM